MAADILNRRMLLKRRPQGTPVADDFAADTVQLAPLADGLVRVRNRYVSIDPAMRVWLGPPGGYVPPVEVGAVMRSFAVGEVVGSTVAEFAEGDLVVGLFGWQDFADVAPSAVMWRVAPTEFPLSYALGILGVNGITAYIGVTEICRPAAGQTLVVSTAAGAVGSAAGQIARLLGAHAVGITGGEAKRRLCIDAYGFRDAVDYKAHRSIADLSAALGQACPDGIDCYFDNTAGLISDAVRTRINTGARIALCGTSSIESWSPWPMGERVERHLLNKRASMQGFVATDHAHRFGEAQAQLAMWLRSGGITYREHVLEGLEAAPGAIAMLFEGRNDGKLIVKL